MQPNIQNRTRCFVASSTRLAGAQSYPEPDTTTGTDTDINQWQVQTGLDTLIHADSSGRFFVGVTFQYGKADADGDYSFGDGSIDTTARSLGLTATWLVNNGFYADG